MSRLKLPKEHVAGGFPLRIKRTTRSGGFFDTAGGIIEIGNDICDFTFVEFLLHECLEASTCMHEVRYGAQTEQYVIVLDHRTFKVIVAELAGTVLKLLKANGYKEIED